MNGFTKRISFHEGGRDHHYKEQVAGLSVTELTRMLTACGFEIKAHSGITNWTVGVRHLTAGHFTCHTIMTEGIALFFVALLGAGLGEAMGEA